MKRNFHSMIIRNKYIGLRSHEEILKTSFIHHVNSLWSKFVMLFRKYLLIFLQFWPTRHKSGIEEVPINKTTKRYNKLEWKIMDKDQSTKLPVPFIEVAFDTFFWKIEDVFLHTCNVAIVLSFKRANCYLIRKNAMKYYLQAELFIGFLLLTSGKYL